MVTALVPSDTGVLGQLAGQDEAHGSLDLAAGHCRLLGVARELGGLRGDFLELVLDERVQDGDGLAGDAGVGVDLLEDPVDVDFPGLDALALLALAVLLSGRDLLGRGDLRGFLSAVFGAMLTALVSDVCGLFDV